MGRTVFEGIRQLWAPLPGKAIKLFFCTSPKTLSPTFNSVSGYRGRIQLHLQGTQHLVPGCLIHLHKDVREPPPKPVCFTGQHPPSPSSAPGPGTPAPTKLRLMTQGLELWGTSGQKPGHSWCSGRPSPLTCDKAAHDAAHWLPGQPIRESGILGSEGSGRDTHWRACNASLTANHRPPCSPRPSCTPSSMHPQGPGRREQGVGGTRALRSTRVLQGEGGTHLPNSTSLRDEPENKDSVGPSWTQKPFCVPRFWFVGNRRHSASKTFPELQTAGSNLCKSGKGGGGMRKQGRGNPETMCSLGAGSRFLLKENTNQDL